MNNAYRIMSFKTRAVVAVIIVQPGRLIERTLSSVVGRPVWVLWHTWRDAATFDEASSQFVYYAERCRGRG